MRYFTLYAAAFALAAGEPASAEMTDAAARQAIIEASIAAYPGNCPCPYNKARNGSRCGGRSAWSRAGGHAPKCYPADVTAAEVKAHRSRRAGPIGWQSAPRSRPSVGARR